LSRQFTKEFLIEVSKGKVPGHDSFLVIGAKESITTASETVWDLSGNFTFPSGDESWELLSDDTNDTLSGTGAQKVIVAGLDSNFDRQTEIVNMDGTTPVVLARTDWNRSINTAVFSKADNINRSNIGTITLRVSGGDTRATILPGKGRSFNGFYTVPKDKTSFLMSIISFTPKGEDIILDPLARVFGSNAWISGGITPLYQKDVIVPFNTFPRFETKTDLEPRVESTNTNIKGSVGLEILEVDNQLVSSATPSIAMS